MISLKATRYISYLNISKYSISDTSNKNQICFMLEWISVVCMYYWGLWFGQYKK